MDKKVLIITYYWPPAGGPGVQRWLKFVKYLPGLGIEPHVYIPENPAYPIIDRNLVGEVPRQAVIVRKKIIEPYKFASFFSGKKTKKLSAGIIPSERKQTFSEKVALWIRGNIFIPDARVFWVRPSVRFLSRYLIEHKIDTIITTGPPHSLHMIGLRLKSVADIKWIADFRDPWTTIGYHKELKLTPYSEGRHKDLEKMVLRRADQIIVTSKTTKADFEVITSKPIEVITNGYDLEQVPDKGLDRKFSLAHIGSLLSERNPRFLWQALSEIIKENDDFKTDFELKLIGNVSRNVLDALNTYGLSDHVLNLGYVSHSEAIVQQRSSQLLLLIEINSAATKSIIPGKLFEYMVSGRPIIGIGPTGSDFADILIETNTGVFIDYAEKEKLKASILRFYQAYKTGSLKASGVGLQKYSRENLTKHLATLLTQ
ncbi:MAG TPA: glycosyltransferase family 4 protein [Flavobacterium sp.]